MPEYIDRQAAIDALGEEPEIWCETDEEAATRNQWERDKVAIEAVPPADVRPVVRGRWERRYSRPDVYADLFWHCSACGYKIGVSGANTYSYCPNCGADMREGGADGDEE